MSTNRRAALCGIGAGALLAASAAVGAPGAPGAWGESPLVAMCGGTVTGTQGQQVDVSGSSVLAVLPPAARLLTGLVSALSSPVPVGSVAASDTRISGDTVADAVVGRVSSVPLIGPLLGGIRSSVAGSCGVTVRTLEAVVAPVAPVTSAVTSVVTTVVPQTSRLLPTTAAAPASAAPAQAAAAAIAADSVSTAVPSIAGFPAELRSFSFDVSQLLSSFGPLRFDAMPYADYASLYTLSGFDPNQFAPAIDTVTAATTGTATAAGDDTSRVATTSQVQALPVVSRSGRIGTPVLLAALAVAAAAAVLARSAALRWSRPR